MSKILLVDMDDTITDYDAQLYKYAKTLKDVIGSDLEVPMLHGYDVPENTVKFRDYIWNTPGFWQNMPIKPRGFEFLQLFRDMGYYICTVTKGPLAATNAWTEKINWLKSFLEANEIHNSIVVSGEKFMIYGNVMLEDNVDNVEDWLTFWPKSKAIIMTNERNKDYSHNRALHEKYITDTGILQAFLEYGE